MDKWESGGGLKLPPTVRSQNCPDLCVPQCQPPMMSLSAPCPTSFVTKARDDKEGKTICPRSFRE